MASSETCFLFTGETAASSEVSLFPGEAFNLPNHKLISKSTEKHEQRRS
jgi:hypothetical protein